MRKAGFNIFLLLFLTCGLAAQESSPLLFHLSAEEGVVADYARGSGEPGYLSRTTCPAIPAPLDLQPKTADVRLAVPVGRDLRGCRVVIDPDNALCELYETNNSVIL